ncbi:hypothetical protein ACFLSG_04330 [Candidatus Bipolaricaulota bacterium]
MSIKSLLRFCALAGLLSTISIILGKFLIPLPNRQIGEVLDTLGAFFGLFLVIGVYLMHRRQSGVFGGVAALLLFTGLTAVVSLDYFGAFMALELPAGTVDMLLEGRNGWVFAASGVIFLLGAILFGFSIILAKVFSKAAAVLFMLGMIPVALHLTGIFPEHVVNISSIVAGIGLIWWSVELMRMSGEQKRTEQDTTAPREI